MLVKAVTEGAGTEILTNMIETYSVYSIILWLCVSLILIRVRYLRNDGDFSGNEKIEAMLVAAIGFTFTSMVVWLVAGVLEI